MKIVILLAKDNGEEMPWVIGAWDEYSIDANGVGFHEAVEEGKKKYDDFRTAVIEIPEGFLESAFKPLTAGGIVGALGASQTEAMNGVTREGQSGTGVK